MADENSPGGSFITRKMGPFPLWGWAVIAGAAFGVLFIVRRQSSGYPTQGTPAVGSAGLGVTQADPLTAQQLLMQMGSLTTTLQGMLNGQQSVGGNPSAGQLLLTSFSDNPHGVTVWSYDRNNQGIIGYLPLSSLINYISSAPGFLDGRPGWLIHFGDQVGWVSGQDVANSGPSGATPI